MVIVESAGLTDVGRKRKGNEDSYFIDAEQRLYVVSDGMGGHRAGEVASNLVVETIKDYMQRFKTDGEVEELTDIDESLSKDSNRLLSSIFLANRVVNQVAQKKESTRGMGATVSAVSIPDETIIAANVGDSPIYLVRRDTIELLSTMHTVMAEQMALDPKNAQKLGARFKHVLTRAMGTQENVGADLCELQCYKDDRIVISSDGLSDKVLPEEIMTVVLKEPPKSACRILVDMANERGGEDNVTVVVLWIKKIRRRFKGLWRWMS